MIGSLSGWFARTVLLLALPLGSQAQAPPPVQTLEPPPEPDVEPIVPRVLSEDSDRDRIEDQLLVRLRETELQLRRATSPEESALIQAQLDAIVPVELVFSKQVTQSQIDAFLAAGGNITHLYRAVSYGWNATLRLGDVERIAAAMGDSLVILQETKPVRLHPDGTATLGHPAPRKISPDLLVLHEEYTAHQGRRDGQAFEPSRPAIRTEAEKVLIDAVASTDAPGLLSALEGRGLERASLRGRIVSGWLPISAITRLAELDNLHFVRPTDVEPYDPDEIHEPLRPEEPVP